MKLITFFVASLLSVSAISNEIPTVSAAKYDGNIDTSKFDISKDEKERFNEMIKKSFDKNKSNESVESLQRKINSDEWSERIEKYRTEIAGNLGVEVKDGNIDIGGKDRVLIFISSSIPINTLRNYARDLEKVGGVFIMRGMIGGMKEVKPTALFGSKVLKIDPSCQSECEHRKTEILVDPILFRKYGIDRVPAMTVQRGLNIFDYCHSKDQVSVTDEIVYGDSSLKYSLERFNEDLDIKSVKQFISKLN